MKNSLENSIKQSLENYELAYNSEAWSALSAKLDATSVPSNGDASSSVENAVKSSLENNVYPYNPQAWDALNSRLDANAGNGIEQAVKSSLENYELPYAASAWTAMNAKLDAKDTPRSNTRWYVAASILIAAATVSYFAMNGSTEEDPNSTNSTEIAHNNGSEVNAKNSNSTQSSKQAITENNKNTNSAITSENEVNNASTPAESGNVINASIVDNNNQGNSNSSGNSDDNGASGGGTANPNTNPADEPTPSVMAPFIMPTIGTICQGTSIKIANDNAYNMAVVYPNGTTWNGRANSETTLTTSVAGTYLVGYMRDGQFNESGSFVVNQAPATDFYFVDLNQILLDGLPTTEVKTSTPGIKHEWKYDKNTSYGTEAAPNFYKKGNYDIELTVTGSNGCQSSITKTVNIDKTYNLLAVNAFDPRSLDSRNNTFMPRALVERENVEFTMIIADMADGHIMYQTSDASQGWDGVDRTTGQQLDYQKNFFWKVVIENPEPGESPVYQDDAIIIPRQN